MEKKKGSNGRSEVRFYRIKTDSFEINKGLNSDLISPASFDLVREEVIRRKKLFKIHIDTNITKGVEATTKRIKYFKAMITNRTYNKMKRTPLRARSRGNLFRPT